MELTRSTTVNGKKKENTPIFLIIKYVKIKKKTWRKKCYFVNKIVIRRISIPLPLFDLHFKD